MNLLISFFVCLLAMVSLPAQESEQIVVQLATDNQLMPVYLAKFTNDQSGFDLPYVRQLEQVLQFDLNHNGNTCTVNQTDGNEKLAQKIVTEGKGSQGDWKPLIYYVVSCKVDKEKCVNMKLVAINGSGTKQAKTTPLTGTLSRDRREIHKLADALYKALFNSEGIATTHLLYTIRKPLGDQWSSEVWEADYDGANAHLVIKDTNYNLTPVYVPPKTGSPASQFFYVSYRGGQPKIYLGSLKQGTASRFSTLKGNQLMPAISKQCDKVAYICDVTGNPDLFLQKFNMGSSSTSEGKAQQIFSGHKASQGSPTFSPDGKKLAFVTNKDGSPKIYIMTIPAPGTKLKDTKITLVTKHCKESSAPTWSPDGTKLAYCAMTQGVRQIWIYDFNSHEERQLTKGKGNKENPSWAPNSQCLVYNSSDRNNSELFILALGQSQPTKLSLGSGEKRFPNWEPR